MRVTPAPTSRRPRAAAALLAALATVCASLAVLPAASAVDTGTPYVLVNRNSGKALDVYNFASGDGARLTQWTRGTATNQQWRFIDAGDGTTA